jgi:3-hydroxyacyl-[acyl-carrier-protein] dehydratase
MIGYEGVRRILPHRGPMLLVDRVLSLEPGRRLTAVKNITGTDPWIAGAPGSAAYPPVLLVESWCQAAGVLVTNERPNPDVLTGDVLLFGGMSEVRIAGPVVVGDVLRHTVSLVRDLGDSAVVEGTAEVGDRVVLEVGRVIMARRKAGVLRPGAASRGGEGATDG